MVVAPGFRIALTGIIFLLKSGIPWEMLLLELGCSSGVTCRRRLRDWQEAGVWDRLHRELLDRGGEADQIDWSRASLASARIPANGGGGLTGPNPTDRCKPGAKRHSVVERGGHALATLVTAANRHDSVVFAELLDAILPITRANGRRKRPGKLHADKGYDIPRCGAAILGVRIAHKGIHSSARLGRHRRVVERPLAWLNRFRRPTVRFERRGDIHQAFLTLAGNPICFNILQDGFERRCQERVQSPASARGGYSAAPLIVAPPV